MCWMNQSGGIPAAPRTPSRNSAEVDRRVSAVTQPLRQPMATVLTSPLGDPAYGTQINRTVLTGVLT